MDAIDLLVTQLQNLKTDQEKLGDKFDALHQYITDHMDKEEIQITALSVAVARLEEKVAMHSSRWGAIHTILTSVIVSALGFVVGRGIL